MTKIVEQLRCIETGIKYQGIEMPMRLDIRRIDDVEIPDNRDGYEITYSYRYQFSALPIEVKHFKRLAAQEILHEVYGELKNRLMYLERDIYDGDRERVLSGIRDIMKTISY